MPDGWCAYNRAMRSPLATDKRTLILATLAVLLATPAHSACILSHCKKAPTRSYITNTHRQIVGDLYKPTPDRRTQIRDNHRRIIGYIEADGRITDTERREVGSIEALR